MEKTGCTPDMSVKEIGEKIIPIMTQIKVDGITGEMTWNANGEVSKTPKAVIIKNGAYVAY